MSKNWDYAAGILWPILVELAKSGKKLYYSDIAPKIQTSALKVSHGLAPIFFYCKDNNLPPLTSLIINKKTNKPGFDFSIFGAKDSASAQKMVYEYDWSMMENPFIGLNEDCSIESLSDEILENPESSHDIYNKVQLNLDNKYVNVKTRGIAQIIFRKSLLKAYNCKCAMCELDIEDVLEAAHIIPWNSSSSENRISPNNGLLLCANHHKLFDAGKIEVTENLKIKIHHDDDVLPDILKIRKLNLPDDERLHPSIEAIKYRNQIIHQ